jgi:hypothetical protein
LLVVQNRVSEGEVSMTDGSKIHGPSHLHKAVRHAHGNDVHEHTFTDPDHSHPGIGQNDAAGFPEPGPYSRANSNPFK